MRFIGPLGIASLMTFAAAAEAGAAVAEAPETAGENAGKKSIVPVKYAGKYAGGGSDALAEFIKSQCVGKDGFEFTAFFLLCRKNGVPEEKVAHYEGLIAEKAHGAEGRARMTLRNMMAAIVRREGKLIGTGDQEHELSLPKPAVSGAAAKQQEAAAAAAAESDPEGGNQDEDEDDESQ